MLTGPDLSTWQPAAKIDWRTVRAHNDFVFYRAMYGLTADDEFAAHRANARREGFVLTGAYAYLRPGDAAEQAEAFLALTGEALANEVFVLQAESYQGWRPSVANMVAWANTVRAAQPGVTRLLYCSASFWTDVLAADPSILDVFDGLWIEAHGPLSPFGAVDGALFWQFTDGTVPTEHATPGAGHCGCSYFDGDRDALRALATLHRDPFLFTNDVRMIRTYVSQLLSELEAGFALRAAPAIV